MNGVVTSISPPLLRGHGDLIDRPIAQKPSGMTLAVDDVVVFDMVGNSVWVTQRMVPA